MMKHYKIADVTIAVSSDLPITDGTFGEKFKPFEANGPGEDTIHIHHRFQAPPFSGKALGDPVYKRAPWAIYRGDGSWIYTGILKDAPEKPFFQSAVFNQDHSRGELYHGAPQEAVYRKGNLHALTLFPTDQILLARIMADREAFFIHSAGVVYNGEGYLFVGHSEAGKSTTTRIFGNAGAKILCDDRIVIRKHPDGYRIHGTWSHGDVPECCPDSAPLKGIYFLEQAPVNELIPIENTFSIVQRLLPCLIKGLVTPDWMGKMLELIEALSRSVGCFRMLFDKSGGIVKTVSGEL